MQTAEYWIEHLQLEKHPEGGWFKEIYRDEGIIFRDGLPARYKGSRSYSTAIYYLLRSGECSALHRLISNEQWFHIDGNSLAIHTITPSGEYTKQMLGKNFDSGEKPFAVVLRENWFGATVESSDSFALVGCIVAPGFDFDDFELAERTALAKKFPEHKEIIEALTR